jgi:Uma2 family endonuclease
MQASDRIAGNGTAGGRREAGQERHAMVSTKLFTIDDLIALGPDAAYEIVEGELVEASPTFANSSLVMARLATAIGHYVVSNELGLVSFAEGGYILRRDPDTLVAPDIGFIANGRLPNDYDGESFYPLPPDFAVEVISSSDRPAEVTRKLSLYQEAGVPLVWIVYPKQRAVTVYTLGEPPVTMRAGQELTGGAVLPGMRINLDLIFATMLNV